MEIERTAYEATIAQLRNQIQVMESQLNMKHKEVSELGSLIVTGEDEMSELRGKFRSSGKEYEALREENTQLRRDILVKINKKIK